jgi:hypothetical protein
MPVAPRHGAGSIHMRKTLALCVMFVASLGLLFAAYASVPL